MATQIQINQTILELTQGDITQEETDAIVNAANSSLLGGGGVDGAIHRAAGSQLLAETSQLGGCKTGDAKLTKGYRLKAKYVIHGVGPIYRAKDPHVSKMLASVYQRSLEIATAHQLVSIAFPAISTGIYGYPMQEAAEISLKTVISFLENNTQLKLVRFVLFTDDALRVFEEKLSRLI